MGATEALLRRGPGRLQSPPQINLTRPRRTRRARPRYSSRNIPQERTMTQLKPNATDELGKVTYTAKTHTIGGRENGVSRSSDGRLDVKISPPGTPRIGTNPEQLFAAGW